VVEFLKEFLEGHLALKPMEGGGNNRSVMPLDVLCCTSVN